MKVLDLFSGIGGFSLGLERAGFETVAFCEIEDYPRKVLAKHWPGVPIYDDVRELTAERLISDGIGDIDVITGGFPCQDLSICGHQLGFEGVRSSLYAEMQRLVGECMPRWTIFENVTGLLTGDEGRWFSRFLNDLASLGYDAQWHCISASAIGAAHHRDRVWIIAYPHGANVEGVVFPESMGTYSEESRRRQHSRAIDACIPADDFSGSGRDSYDVPASMDRLKSLGNSVVPKIPELIGRAIMEAERALI